RRERCAERQDPSARPEIGIRGIFTFQDGRRALEPRRPVAARAALRAIELRAFFGGSFPGRKFLSGRTDGDVACLDFVRGRRASYPECRTLRQRGGAHEQKEREREKPMRTHWSPSRRSRRATAEHCC